MTPDTDTDTDTETEPDADIDRTPGDEPTADYRVLVPVDRNEARARAQADYVADLPAAAERVEAILMHVFTREESEEIPEDLGRYKSADRVTSVRRARDRLEERGITVRLLDTSGRPARAILEAAEEYDVDSVVVGGRKRSTAEEAIFGSVSQRVIHGTDRPVVITGDEHV